VSSDSVIVERISAEHDLTRFHCGRRELDDWLHRHAITSDRMDRTRVFVAHTGNEIVIGYFSLTMGSVLRDGPPAQLIRGLPRHPVGIALLARLAIDEREQGHGLGADLLHDALEYSVRAGESVAARLVVVDALDDNAAKFYQRFGFIPSPNGDPLRLYRRVKDIRTSMGISGS